MKTSKFIASQTIFDQQNRHIQLLQQIMAIVQQSSGVQAYQAIAQQISSFLAINHCVIWSSQPGQLTLQADCSR
ncbi:MAG: hypothetical protein F6K04_23765 [Leptolyngbya sp. SIO4C5]|nr:hypothetical protein [Leptolyngbya sp. SIO4C5]